MRVLALGGAGGMGSHACRLVAANPRFDDVVIADLDFDRAADAAARLGGPARALALDVTDHRSLIAALEGCDVVLNTVGPFFRFGVPILQAAIDTGCHYLDICDDPEPTVAMVDLDQAARDAGITAVIGMGASPGMSNLLAVTAMSELDTVDAVVTGWNLEVAQPEPGAGRGVSAALVHGIEQMTGRIPVIRDGHLVEDRPLQRIEIDYPGLGPRPAWTFGHPEPLTLARNFPQLRESVNAAHASRSFVAMAKSIGWSVDRGVLSRERAARMVHVGERLLPAPKPSTVFNASRLPPLYGHAVGTHAGRPASVGAALTRPPGTTMGELTGIPLAVALSMLAGGDCAGAGVHGPETAFAPAAYFSALAPFCAGQPEPAGMVSVVRSWDATAGDQFRTAITDAYRYADKLAAQSARSRGALFTSDTSGVATLLGGI